MQLGFVIDHSRCIGCHACTVACKSENDVPLGSFRTWVKYTEEGSFPHVRRSFAVLRCNQCTQAPCVEICPVHALEKRPDGIVDVDPERCIGCKSCLQGCPYDALYVNDASGTVEKCHFCAHRTEVGLAPACAVVCPTEAIVPGDFDDPHSVVSRMKADGPLTARKVEAGTGPNVLYKDAHPAGLDPSRTNAGGGYLWAEQQPGAQLDAQLWEALERRATARTVYDVAHPPAWGGRVSAYLFTKSLSAGTFLAAAPLLLWGGGLSRAGGRWVGGLALAFLLVTTLLLVLDLKRPERFLYILRYPNWSSWLTRGSVILIGYGALLTVWLGLEWSGRRLTGLPGTLLVIGCAVGGALTAVYTAWLFAQAKGRVLWMRRGLALELFVHAILGGGALLLLLAAAGALPGTFTGELRGGLAVALLAHLALILGERAMAPSRREAEYRRAARLVTHGPYARWHWIAGVGLGAVAPLALLFLTHPAAWVAVAVLVLVGLIVEQEILVRAGQAAAIS